MSYLNLFTDEEKYGATLRYSINVINNDERNYVTQFRKIYSLSKEDFPDDYLNEILIKNNFNFELAFSSLYG